MTDQNHGRYSDIFIFIPEKRQVIRIAEGSGDNLLHEDIEEGYVDYIYYAQHELDVDMPEVDGGMVLLEKPLRDKYRCMADCIPDVLDMAYGIWQLHGWLYRFNVKGANKLRKIVIGNIYMVREAGNLIM